MSLPWVFRSFLICIFLFYACNNQKEPLEEPPFIRLALYDVSEGQFKLMEKAKKFSNEEWGNEKKHRQIWDVLAKLVPANLRTELVQFELFYEPDVMSSGLHVGQLRQKGVTEYNWRMELNIKNFFYKDYPHDDAINGTFHLDTQVWSEIMLHEYSHVVTKSHSQMDPSGTPTFNSHDSYKTDAYLYRFFYRFWDDILEEREEIENYWENDKEEYDRRRTDFYKKYSDRFIRRYCSKSPDEDIAESMMYFLLGPKLSEDSIRNQKINFFYDYPELVSTREVIQSNLYFEVEFRDWKSESE